MSQPPCRPEALVLDALHDREPILLDQIAEGIPELSWNELFQAVDALSRRGELILYRKRFAYYVSLPHMSRISA